jgi:hypothetical protein
MCGERGNKLKYLGINLKNAGCWKNQETSVKANSNQTLTVIDKCLAITNS